jgi:hypothetical protein
MDWRLIAAISAAGGSFCLVAVGAYVVLTRNPVPQQAAAPAPILLSGYRFPAMTAPSLLNVEAAPSSPFASQGSFAPEIPVVASGTIRAPVGIGTSATAPSPNPPRVIEDSNKRPGRTEAKQEQRIVGQKTAALTPANANVRSEPPPRPVVEVKKSALVPELHTALPAARYHGVLTSAEIVRIKHSLRLTPDQEPAWPSVEAALGEMGRQQMTLIRRGQEPRISQGDWPPGRLYAAAGPLLRILRPDQKEVVRRLCRSLGFENVASMI